MSHDDPRLVEMITTSKSDVSSKVIKLFAVAMLNYRRPLGEAAGDQIRTLIGDDATTALYFLTGAAASKGDWRNLLDRELKTP